MPMIDTPCQHQLTGEAQRCRHGLHYGTTCEDCILTCPKCWDLYDAAATYGPRPPTWTPEQADLLVKRIDSYLVNAKEPNKVLGAILADARALLHQIRQS